MIKIIEFDERHIKEASFIAMENYNEERSHVQTLPMVETLPDFKHFAENGLGVAAFDEKRMLGFLCCFEPWDNAFNSTARGTFSPIHGNGAIKENRGYIYKKLYQAAAEKWIKHKIAYHAIGLYAHDNDAIDALFSYGFGLRCMDAVKAMENFRCQQFSDIKFLELPKSDVIQVREMRRMLSEHLGCSPCFMYSSPHDFQNWIARAETRNSRLFVANSGERHIAFIEIVDSGENFATEENSMQNIRGAFCLAEYRGSGIFQSLLNYAIYMLKPEGYTSLGVDFESFNPTGSGFWLKYFTAYTSSVVRRIDECAIHE